MTRNGDHLNSIITNNNQRLLLQPLQLTGITKSRFTSHNTAAFRANRTRFSGAIKPQPVFRAKAKHVEDATCAFRQYNRRADSRRSLCVFLAKWVTVAFFAISCFPLRSRVPTTGVPLRFYFIILRAT